MVAKSLDGSAIAEAIAGSVAVINFENALFTAASFDDCHPRETEQRQSYNRGLWNGCNRINRNVIELDITVLATASCVPA